MTILYVIVVVLALFIYIIFGFLFFMDTGLRIPMLDGERVFGKVEGALRFLFWPLVMFLMIISLIVFLLLLPLGNYPSIRKILDR